MQNSSPRRFVGSSARKRGETAGVHSGAGAVNVGNTGSALSGAAPGRSARVRSYALLQLLLHFWLVAVFPINHALSDAHVAKSVVLASQASAEAPVTAREPESPPADGHELLCVFCRVLSSPLLPDDQSVVFAGDYEAEAHPERIASEPPTIPLPSPVARGPPALIG